MPPHLRCWATIWLTCVSRAPRRSLTRLPSLPDSMRSANLNCLASRPIWCCPSLHRRVFYREKWRALNLQLLFFEGHIFLSAVVSRKFNVFYPPFFLVGGLDCAERDRYCSVFTQWSSDLWRFASVMQPARGHGQPSPCGTFLSTSIFPRGSSIFFIFQYSEQSCSQMGNQMPFPVKWGFTHVRHQTRCPLECPQNQRYSDFSFELIGIHMFLSQSHLLGVVCACV